MFDKTSGYSDLAKFLKFTMKARVFRENKEKFLIYGMSVRDPFDKNSDAEPHPQTSNAIYL